MARPRYTVDMENDLSWETIYKEHVQIVENRAPFWVHSKLLLLQFRKVFFHIFKHIGLFISILGQFYFKIRGSKSTKALNFQQSDSIFLHTEFIL